MKIWPLRTMAIGCRETARNLSNFMGYNDVFEANITSADVFSKSWSKEGTIRYRQSKEASILWSHNKKTRELPGESDKEGLRNNAWCTQARKTTHGLDGQQQDVDVVP